MTYLILGLISSTILNIFLIWYVFKLLTKLLYTSDNLGDLYVTFRLFEDFVISLYQMEAYHGEPIVQELIGKTKLVREELERFEEIYGLTTEVELLEEDLMNDRNFNEEEEEEEA